MDRKTIKQEAKALLQENLRGGFGLSLIPVFLKTLVMTSVMFLLLKYLVIWIDQLGTVLPDDRPTATLSDAFAWGNAAYGYQLFGFLGVFSSLLSIGGVSGTLQWYRQKAAPVHSIITGLAGFKPKWLVSTLIAWGWTWLAMMATNLIFIGIPIGLSFTSSYMFYIVFGLLPFMLIPSYIVALRLSMVPYLLFDRKEASGLIKGRALIRESLALTKGHTGAIFLAQLSFIGWLALAAALVGLAGLLEQVNLEVGIGVSIVLSILLQASLYCYQNLTFAGIYNELLVSR